MRFHSEEHESAKGYWKGRAFPGMSAEQRKTVSEKGMEMLKFHLRHPALHILINLSVFAVIFISDYWVLLRLGAYIMSPISAGIIIGILHSCIMYNLVIFTIHEGAAHKLIVPRGGPISNFFNIIANNLGRVALAESDYYAKNHLAHHAYFATPRDGEFLNFVFPKRLLKAFVPYASIFNIGDFKAHSGLEYTPSRIFSTIVFLLYHSIFAILMAGLYSRSTIIIALVLIAPNLAFWLDRLRQYMEHNLMPLDVTDGARDLGLGPWGMLIGGGPWGQPCHWTHHLFPGIPWYNQLRLHNFVRKTLTPEQKKVFLLKPIIGFPQVLFNIIRTTARFQNKA